MEEKMKVSGETLSKSLFFGGLSPDIISRIEKKGRMEKFGRDEIIFFEGDKGEKFFFLVDGLVKIYKSADSDREVVLRVIRPGEIFGEVVLFESENYPVSAVAMRDTVLFSINRSIFMELFSDDSFRKYFTGNIFRKLRYLADRVAFLNAYDVEERFFLFIEEHYGLKPVISIDMSKAEVADGIGTIPETMSRLLARLKLKDYVNWNRNDLKIDVDYARSVIDKVKDGIV
jgi:CRP/FNR family transcriptional regulator